jgi:hypothetical protein
MQRTASGILGALAFVMLLAGCWHSTQPVTPSRPVAVRTPPEAPRPTEASYRSATLSLDAVGIGLLAASTAAYAQRGGDDPLAVGLLLAGGLTMLGTPVVHALHRQWPRAGASYLLRTIFVTTGMVVGMEIGCARDPGWLCGLGPELGWGAVGGFVVAGALDALLLHGSRSTWTPTITPSDDGARVGIARTF